MESGPIRQVTIVGGGTAGWMCAAAMSRMLAGTGVGISLVESEEIGTVGVGEATIPTIRDFNTLLGIDEDDFVRATQGSFKLGIEFVDWLRTGHRYIHPFGYHGRDLPTLKFHQLWLRLRQSGPEGGAAAGPIEDCCLSAVAAKLGRFARPVDNPNNPLSTIRYAFHFDAGLYARYLRGLAESRGVVRIEGRIVEVRQRPEDGHVRSVLLADGREVEGELFIDCSGFRSLLLGETLGVGFEDWSRWLPCDRAVAMPSANVGPPAPFTRATADVAGWRWRIPLQHRTGNGHVYSSAFLSDDEAVERLTAGLGAPAVGAPRFLRFTAGRRRLLWDRNVVAIGLAGGFLEPLESTSIHLIQMGIARMMMLFPDRRFAAADRDEFNRQSLLEYEQVRDFIILHYKATARTDTPFWRERAAMDVPDSLQAKIDLFRSKGRIFRHQDELFTEDSWLAVMLGQGIDPAGHDPVADAHAPADIARNLTGLRTALRGAAEAMPTHQQFIDRFCSAANAA